MMNSFNHTIDTTPYSSNCYEDSSVELATSNADGHMNLIVRKRDKRVDVCLHPDDAKALRDALNTAYLRNRYEAENGNVVRVSTAYELVEGREHVASTHHYADAVRIAGALNKAAA